MAKKRPISLETLEKSLGAKDTAELTGTRPDIADEMAGAEALLAGLAELAAPADPPKGLFRAIEAEIDSKPAGKQATTLRADQGEWKKRSTKIWQKILHEDPESGRLIYLLRCEPGAVIPPHRHKRDEHVFVLEGEYRVKKMVVRAGDFQSSPAGSYHATIASPKGCLVMVHC